MTSLNTVWLLICGTLVFFMQAGFAMLETGFTRAKNAGNIVMKNIIDICIGAPVFFFIGFGLMFGKNCGFIGNLDLFIRDDYTSLLPDRVSLCSFVFYQITFCATAATIVSGAMAERTKFSAYCIYSVIISMFVYPIVGHWIWGGGWLSKLGFHDFAGGTVVHTVGGMAALMGAKIVGPRIDKYDKNGRGKAIPGHNIILGALGIMILWFGWFGFNAGSSLKADGLAAHAFMTSGISAASALLSWMLIDTLISKKTTLVGASTGLVVGLVAITPGAGFVPIWASFIIGALVSPICYFGVSLIKKKLKIDDALDAFGCHGIGGIWGGIATGIFTQKSINSTAKWDGLIFGDYHLFAAQIVGILVTAAVAVVGTLICVAIVRLFTTLRVDKCEEQLGLDISQHGESAYPSFNGLDQ